MMPSCPSCQSAFTPGSLSCPSCGASLLLAATPGSPEPVCSLHPDLRGLGTCSRCGAFACARCLRTGDGDALLCAACHAREPAGLLAWDRRDELGTLKAFWKTCIDLMLRPMPTLEGARPTGSLGSSLFFALLCSVTGYLMTGLFYTVVIGAMFSFLTPPATPPPNAMDADSTRAMVMGTFGIWTLLTPVFGVLATLISSCFDHLVLKLAGAQRSFEVTLRANALSQGPMLLGLIPFISLYVAPFWSIGLRVVTYRALHRTGWGTAVAGALAAPALLCVGCGGCYALLFMRMLHSLPTFPH